MNQLENNPHPHTLFLMEDEIILIAKLVSHIRLGDGNRFSEAAYSILKAIDFADESLFDKALDEIYFDMQLENDKGEVVATMDGDNCIINVMDTLYE